MFEGALSLSNTGLAIISWAVDTLYGAKKSKSN